MDDHATVYRYDPTPEPPPEPGVTRGWLVIWSGAAGAASVAEAAVLHDTDGTIHVEPTGEFQPCTIVDDTEETP